MCTNMAHWKIKKYKLISCTTGFENTSTLHAKTSWKERQQRWKETMNQLRGSNTFQEFL